MARLTCLLYYFELAEAIRTGAVLILDELNLVSSEILTAMRDIFAMCQCSTSSNSRMVENPVSLAKVAIHENFRMFATQKDEGVAGRNRLPSTILARSIVVKVQKYDKEQLQQILKSKATSGTYTQGMM